MDVNKVIYICTLYDNLRLYHFMHTSYVPVNRLRLRPLYPIMEQPFWKWHFDDKWQNFLWQKSKKGKLQPPRQRRHQQQKIVPLWHQLPKQVPQPHQHTVSHQEKTLQMIRLARHHLQPWVSLQVIMETSHPQQHPAADCHLLWVVLEDIMQTLYQQQSAVHQHKVCKVVMNHNYHTIIIQVLSLADL